DKVVVTVCWPATWLIHHSFLNRGATIKSEKYCQQINEVHCKLQQQRPALINRKGPILHDNFRSRVAKLALQKLNEFNDEILPHLPHSSHFSLTFYHLIKHLDNFLRNKCFANHDDAKISFNEFIASGTPELYASEINKLVSLWK
ncbi:hypothetical protein Angca_003903, partial [Angiostrongylus cantonensis]